MQRAGIGFLAGQKRRADLRGVRAQGERRRDPAAIDDAARGDHRHRYRVDHIGHQRQRASQAIFRFAQERDAMPTRLHARGHDHVNAGIRQ
jgi:hypothetical protein